METKKYLDNQGLQYYSNELKKQVIISSGEQFTIGNAVDGYTKISFQLHDNIALRGYILNNKTNILSPSQWSDANNITTSTQGALLGDNAITIVDMAGNERKYEFKLLES